MLCVFPPAPNGTGIHGPTHLHSADGRDGPSVAMESEATIFPLQAAEVNQLSAHCLLVRDEIFVTHFKHAHRQNT